jgi:hypothetical protein
MRVVRLREAVCAQPSDTGSGGDSRK